jgi:DNA-binding transcriptional ArsR family regulator
MGGRVIEWTFTPEDVAGIRFAFSPLWEAVMSLIVLRAPASHALHLPWVRATRPMAADLDLSELFALVPVRGPTADFLAPPPASPLPEFAAELEVVRRTPPERVVAELPQVPGLPEPVADRIQEDPGAAVGRLADALQAYWDAALAQHWPRIQALLEADVLWRSRHLALGGTRALFDDLHETITWHGGRLSAADPFEYSGSLSGEGLLLVPSVMPWPDVRKMVEPYQPMLAYPARGIATLWETGTPPAPGALAALVGKTRAALLTALAQPASTTTLAQRLSITPGAVSQHLSVLYGCGLVARSRVSRSVLYRRTRSGDMLLTEDQPS